jgi:hypothetical protein
MSPVLRPRSGLLLLTSALLVSCGGDAGDRDLAAMPQDTFIKPIVREPLTEADLAGTAMAELALEMPWTRNKVSRDAAPGSPPTAVRSAELQGHDGFDRVTFTTGDALSNTGYEIRLAGEGETVACGSESHGVATGALVVTLSPARAGDEAERWIRFGLTATSATRMSRAGLLCDEGGAVTWVAELAQGDQVRVLELREPGRIVVDVR